MDRGSSFGHLYFKIVIVWDMNRSKCMSANLSLALVVVDSLTPFPPLDGAWGCLSLLHPAGTARVHFGY
jgi:hypothetical protein